MTSALEIGMRNATSHRQRYVAMPADDCIGLKFNHWTVIGGAPYAEEQNPRWLCRCDCGKEKSVISSNVRTGKSKSCGCAIAEFAKGRIKDITGRRFGRLSVLRMFESGRDTKWECLCDCGNRALVRGTLLRRGHTQSCGCLQVERTTKHGLSKSPEYKVWIAMKSRCLNENNQAFADYGGRGIGVCDRWMDFSTFLKDMGRRPPETSLERVDVNGDYEPGNCRWATRRDQARNTRRTRVVVLNGTEMILADAIAHLRKTATWKSLPERASTVPALQNTTAVIAP